MNDNKCLFCLGKGYTLVPSDRIDQQYAHKFCHYCYGSGFDKIISLASEKKIAGHFLAKPSRDKGTPND